MKRLLFLIGVLALAPAAWAFQDAKDKPKPNTPDSPAEQFKALQTEFNQARQDIVKKYQAAKDEEEKAKVLQEYYAFPKTFVPRFAELAEKHPRDPAAAQALSWIISNSQSKEDTQKAADALVKNHLDSPEITTLMQRAQYSGPSPAMEKLVRTVMEKSTDPAKQGQATYAMAKMLASKAELIKSLKGDKAEMVKRLEANYGKDLVNDLKTSDPDKTAKEAEDLLETIGKKYADVKTGRGTLAEAAKNDLFEIRNLAIGKVAPEITGEDIDGKAIKLTDYRGKVVVIDFWGHW